MNKKSIDDSSKSMEKLFANSVRAFRREDEDTQKKILKYMFDLSYLLFEEFNNSQTHETERCMHW